MEVLCSAHSGERGVLLWHVSGYDWVSACRLLHNTVLMCGGSLESDPMPFSRVTDGQDLFDSAAHLVRFSRKKMFSNGTCLFAFLGTKGECDAIAKFSRSFRENHRKLRPYLLLLNKELFMAVHKDGCMKRLGELREAMFRIHMAAFVGVLRDPVTAQKFLSLGPEEFFREVKGRI